MNAKKKNLHGTTTRGKESQTGSQNSKGHQVKTKEMGIKYGLQ